MAAFLPLVAVTAPLLIVHVPLRPDFQLQSSELDAEGLAGDLVLCLSHTAASIRWVAVRAAGAGAGAGAGGVRCGQGCVVVQAVCCCRV